MVDLSERENGACGRETGDRANRIVPTGETFSGKSTFSQCVRYGGKTTKARSSTDTASIESRKKKS